MLLQGNSLDKLKELHDNSVDAVVTDPPYGLAFMGKKWDYDVPSVELWREVLRVLKPGGHLLSFGGTRTYHRMVVAIEDAGFEIRDQLQWLYGSGFPKSMDISKAIDKAAGAKREVVGHRESPYTSTARNDSASIGKHKVKVGENGYELHPITAPATPEAQQWQGFGTALKPANEPIVLARKPLAEKTVAKNVLKYGTGGLNIDGTRIETTDVIESGRAGRGECTSEAFGKKLHGTDDNQFNTQGRWPANVLLDETAAAALDSTVDDKNGVSRFFYVAKASKKERNAGLEDVIPKASDYRPGDEQGRNTIRERLHNSIPKANPHPTVKPVKLMSYLVTLVTPPGGTVLDPFMGSGTTGIAAVENGFEFIGIELEEEYFEIANKRIAAKVSA